MLAVGVGCFWFSPKRPISGIEAGKGPIARHLDDVKSALEDIDNVSDLEIVFDSTRLAEASPDDTLDDDDDPLFIDGSIEFDLFLPIRVQQHYGLGHSVEVERFHVSITHAFYFPVTFIHYTVPDQEDATEFSPSGSIIIAREFLQEKLKDHPKVKFNYIGPSPFHAKLIVKSLDGEEGESTVEIVSRGYNTIFVKVSDDEDDLMQVVSDRYLDILSCYYGIIWRRVSLYRSQARIIGQVRGLVDMGESKFPLASLKTMSKRKTTITEIFTDILDDKVQRISLDGFVNEATRDGTIAHDNILRHFLDDALSEIPKLPTDEIRKVVDIVEGRRSSFLQNGATLLAGLLGAIIGSLLTIILSHDAHTQSAPTQDKAQRPAIIAPSTPPALAPAGKANSN